jgi:hypothetical protein
VGGAAGVPGPLLSAAEGQWVCDSELLGCTSGALEGRQVSGYQIGSACVAEPARPKHNDDCTGETKLSCSIGFFDGEAVLFNCECKALDLNQGCPCPRSRGSCWQSGSPEYCDELQAYCGCAMTCITK